MSKRKKKKKKKGLPPRCKRMKREGRLQSARRWLQKYNGKNLVRGYRKHFAVDLLCAVKELKMLGIEIDPDYEAQLRLKEENRIKEKQRQRRRREEKEEERWWEEFYRYSDENFAYIAGYTPGGTPFGTTWEEMEEINERDSLIESIKRGDDELERLAQMVEQDEWLSYEASLNPDESTGVGEEEEVNRSWGYEGME